MKIQSTLSPTFETCLLPRLGLGPRLRSLRKRARLTQVDLAAMAGLHRGTIADLERGRRANICFSTAYRLAVALGLSSALEILEGPSGESFGHAEVATSRSRPVRSRPERLSGEVTP